MIKTELLKPINELKSINEMLKQAIINNKPLTLRELVYLEQKTWFIHKSLEKNAIRV